MKKILIIALLGLLAVSCSKDQSAVKKLTGRWILVSTTTINEDNGTENTDPASETITSEIEFDNCKLAKDEFCTVTFILNDEFYGLALYTVSGDGIILEMFDSKYEDAFGTSEIIELTDTDCKIQEEDENNSSIKYISNYQKV